MQSIDLRGVSCPANFIKAKLALEGVDNGTTVRVLLDAGEPLKNVPRGLKAEGHTLIGLYQAAEGYYALELEKGET